MRPQQGFNLVELMIGIVIFSLLMTLAFPVFTTFLGNTKIRNAAETTMHGITLARAEAVRRNSAVRFQLVSSLTAACVLDATSLNWVVSVSDPTGDCASTPGGAVAPQIVQVKSAAEGTTIGTTGVSSVTVQTTGAPSLVFNGLGRVTGAGITRMVFRSPAGGTCEHEDAAGKMRCMQIEVSTAGAAKICDPKVTDVTDPRKCS